MSLACLVLKDTWRDLKEVRNWPLHSWRRGRTHEEGVSSSLHMFVLQGRNFFLKSHLLRWHVDDAYVALFLLTPLHPNFGMKNYVKKIGMKRRGGHFSMPIFFNQNIPSLFIVSLFQIWTNIRMKRGRNFFLFSLHCLFVFFISFPPL